MNSSCNFTLENGASNASCVPIATKSLPLWYTNPYNVSMVVLYVLVIAAALIGNILVCAAVFINPNLRHNVASYFIVSLAVSDIGTASFAMPFDLEVFVKYGRWYHGEVLCIVWTTAYLIIVPSSIWNLFVMSVDRYNTLKNPWNRFKESHSMTARRAIFTILALWVYCFAFALLPVAGWKFKAYPLSVKNGYCRFNIARYLSISNSFLNFYLPMFAMCGIYYKVYRIAHAHKKFPLDLKTRFHKSSAESQTASNLFATDSLSRPSIDLQHGHDSQNKQDVGLENVSFYFEEDSHEKESTREESFGKESKRATERSSIGGDDKRVIHTKHRCDRSARGLFDNTLQADVIYCCEETSLSKKDTQTSRNERSVQQKKEKQNKPSEDRSTTFAESDAEHKSSLPEAMLSVRPVSAVRERLSSLERDKPPVRESFLEKSHNNTATNVKNTETSNPLTSDSIGAETNPRGDKPKSQDVVAKSLKEKVQCFPLEKKLKEKSPYFAEEEVCRLRKFSRKSVDNPMPSASGGEPRVLDKTSDSLTYSNKRRLKQFSKNTKAARTISVIVGAFLVCWIPFTTISVSFNICQEPCYTLIPVKVLDILLWLGYVNSAINPILFSYQNMQFRKSFRQIGRFLVRGLTA
ncbi:hypothetical protein QZH41_002084 [Actinostola sp. cb2023]|nr:hypothetical protein QZH41_002084 [Actinostola sp. cb2023]